MIDVLRLLGTFLVLILAPAIGIALGAWLLGRDDLPDTPAPTPAPMGTTTPPTLHGGPGGGSTAVGGGAAAPRPAPAPSRPPEHELPRPANTGPHHRVEPPP